MINQHTNFKKYSLIAVIVFLLISLYLWNQNNSVDKKITENSEKTLEFPETKTKENNTENTNTESYSEYIIDENEVISEEYSVIAEEILYPNEYDFGDMLSDTVLAVVGKPIKFDALPITKAKIGDNIELEFDGKVFNAEVFKAEEQYIEAEKGYDAEGIMTYVRFDSYLNPSIKHIKDNQIQGSIIYDKNGVVDGTIRIQDKGGDYVIHIYKQVAYYALEQEWQAEFTNQGYLID